MALGAALLLLAPGSLGAQQFDPEAPVPPEAKFQLEDLRFSTEPLAFSTEALAFRTEPVAGALQALEMKETATEIRIEMPADVLFDFDKAVIRPDAAKVLAQAADVLRRHSKRRAVIEGHTDGRGRDDYNQRLSERRAQAVKQWLQKREDLKMSLATKGWGAKRPVAPNAKPDGSDDPEGRQKNRRVEIVIAK
jgi:outer membrane protein OmpA-like peptidoglycan-associated protein